MPEDLEEILIKLYAIDGPDKGKSFNLSDGITTVGRSSDNDICISDVGVSRHHARLFKTDNTIFIVDLHSFHGVFVDGEKIEPGLKREIGKESNLHIGNSVLSFQQEPSGKKSDQPNPAPEQEKALDTSKLLLVKGNPRTYIRNLELLLKVSNLFAQSLNIDEVLGQVVDQVFKYLERVDRGAILLLNRERGTLREVASKTRLVDKEGLLSKINYSRTIVNRTVKEGRPVMMSDTSQLDKSDLSRSIRQMRIMSIMCAPLKNKGKVQGIIYVDSVGKPGALTKDDLRLLTGLSNAAAVAIENARLYESITQELAGRQKAEKRLIQSEERYRTLVEESFDGIFIRKEAKISFANQRLHQMLGYGRDELLNLDPCLIYHADYQGLVRERIHAGRLGGDIPSHYEVKLERKDGSWFYGEINAQPIRFEGEPGEQVWVRDITERKQAEAALQESEEKYRLLVENANDAIFIIQDEVIKFPNPKTVDLLGYSPDELAEISFFDLVHSEDRDMVLEKHVRTLEGEESPGTCSFRIIYRAAEVLWVQINAVPITWEGRPATLSFLRDIMAEKKMEAQFLQAQKMEAIGTLTGGTAHDFNNLLMCIQGNASLMLSKIDSSHPYHKRLKSIEQSVQRGTELTEELLGFTTGEKYQVKPANLNEFIQKTANLFGRTHKDIKIYEEFQKGIWLAEVDQGQIKHALLSLYVNAGQAMPGGGELQLQTKNVTLDESYVRPYQLKPGKYVRTSITDSGVGMDEATQKRIFDPFFTTKDMGRGTGLGLASVYGIIKNHGGIITVFSKEGEGTTFTIYLPASEKEVAEERPVPEENPTREEIVLLVDDEDMVIDIGKDMLKTLGYKVLLAKGGKEAIEVIRARKDKIDLVILGMTMADIGGGETYDRIREINPQAKVLLSSGYSIEGQAREILQRGCDGFIQKPFGMKELSKKLRKILDKETRGTSTI